MVLAEAPASAQTQPASTTTSRAEEKVLETDHEITLNLNRIAYRALAGDIQIKDHGGPGSSSVWLRMGALFG